MKKEKRKKKKKKKKQSKEKITTTMDINIHSKYPKPLLDRCSKLDNFFIEN